MKIKYYGRRDTSNLYKKIDHYNFYKGLEKLPVNFQD